MSLAPDTVVIDMEESLARSGFTRPTSGTGFESHAREPLEASPPANSAAGAFPQPTPLRAWMQRGRSLGTSGGGGSACAEVGVVARAGSRTRRQANDSAESGTAGAAAEAAAAIAAATGSVQPAALDQMPAVWDSYADALATSTFGVAFSRHLDGVAAPAQTDLGVLLSRLPAALEAGAAGGTESQVICPLNHGAGEPAAGDRPGPGLSHSNGPGLGRGPGHPLASSQPSNALAMAPEPDNGPSARASGVPSAPDPATPFSVLRLLPQTQCVSGVTAPGAATASGASSSCLQPRTASAARLTPRTTTNILGITRPAPQSATNAVRTVASPVLSITAASGAGGGGGGGGGSGHASPRPPSTAGMTNAMSHSRVLAFAGSLRNAPSAAQVLAEGNRRGSFQSSRGYTSREFAESDLAGGRPGSGLLSPRGGARAPRRAATQRNLAVSMPAPIAAAALMKSRLSVDLVPRINSHRQPLHLPPVAQTGVRALPAPDEVQVPPGSNDGCGGCHNSPLAGADPKAAAASALTAAAAASASNHGRHGDACQGRPHYNVAAGSAVSAGDSWVTTPSPLPTPLPSPLPPPLAPPPPPPPPPLPPPAGGCAGGSRRALYHHRSSAPSDLRALAIATAASMAAAAAATVPPPDPVEPPCTQDPGAGCGSSNGDRDGGHAAGSPGAGSRSLLGTASFKAAVAGGARDSRVEVPDSPWCTSGVAESALGAASSDVPVQGALQHGGLAGGLSDGLLGPLPEEPGAQLQLQRHASRGVGSGRAESGAAGCSVRPDTGLAGFVGGGAGAGCGLGGVADLRAECWHEVWATGAKDPVTGEDVIVLAQHDVTAKVVAERHLALVMEAEHRLLEQLFPKHILTHVTEGWVRQEAAPLASHATQSVNSPETSGRGTAGGARPLAPAANARVPSAASVPAVLTPPASSRGGLWRPGLLDPDALSTWHPNVTLLFADIKGFTPMCEQVPPRAVMTMLNQLFSRFDAMLDKFGVFKVETIGDCYFVAGGLIHEDEDGMAAVRDGECRGDPLHAQKVFMFAKAMLAASREVLLPTTGQPVEVRIGIHSGPVVSGVVGTRMPRFCLFGDTVNTTSRMESTGVPGAIHASAAAHALLRSEAWQPTGGIQVKGKGTMQTYLWRPLLEEEEGGGERTLPADAATAAAAAAARLKAVGQPLLTLSPTPPTGAPAGDQAAPAATEVAAAAAGSIRRQTTVASVGTGGRSGAPRSSWRASSELGSDDSDPLATMLLSAVG